ncbi:MAG: phosphatidate cytidylyltransferase [Gammaproteobacteria bacterium HGW-Gammaproteobacteria-8]|nr:MAG: phosphatidate cytidylyltransferase [Gammaproteobacteria bacterium HGW-Gammaproteobacteria-8]
MLKSRVLTALVLAVVVLSALLLLGPMALTAVLAVIFFGVGGWESSALAGLRRPAAIALWVLVLFGCGAGLVYLLHRPGSALTVFGAASAGWLLLAGWLAAPDFGRPAGDAFQPFKLLVLGAILTAGFGALSWLHALDPYWVIYLILVVAAADIGAFFTGSRIGGPKLAPRISPGKTWSGVAGGVLAGLLVAGLAARPFGLPLSPGQAALVALALVAVSIAGDLTISLMKRHRQLKDTSALLPGHGGLLDRLDSLGAAAPVFALALALAREA